MKILPDFFRFCQVNMILRVPLLEPDQYAKFSHEGCIDELTGLGLLRAGSGSFSSERIMTSGVISRGRFGFLAGESGSVGAAGLDVVEEAERPACCRGDILFMVEGFLFTSDCDPGGRSCQCL
jgi:hypothetical protein